MNHLPSLVSLGVGLSLALLAPASYDLVRKWISKLKPGTLPWKRK